MKKARVWRNSSDYKNKYPPNTRRRRVRSFSKCEKYICTSLDTGEFTCGVLFINSGKVKTGLDVWRLTNPADCCDYPVRTFPSLDAAMQHFRFEAAPRSFYYEQPDTHKQAP